MPHFFITGASSGLGAALARHYAAQGHQLSLTGRNEARLQAVAEECQKLGAMAITSYLADVGDANAMEKTIAQANHQQPIDCLIANAGISAGTAGGPEDASQVQAIMAANLEGVWNSLLPAIPSMRARKAGHLVIVSSLAGFRGLPSAPAYSVSKGAARMIGEALRPLLAKDGVAVSVVCPGFIETPMTAVNPFPMPGLMPADKAAAYIARKLDKHPALLAFPWFMAWPTRLMALLPRCIGDRLVANMPGKPSLER
jgi:short-subunit dehydrogenase